MAFIGVGGLIILGVGVGARFRILGGGPRGGPNSQQDVMCPLGF